ncbi:ammonium transporter 2-like isoform X2 [Halichondria panicea]|uniref:ammonium transporter 2-like isoform X2 n=1 Tax=Halichondria panicea TaxID=6063 RepID=UPI00312B3402
MDMEPNSDCFVNGGVGCQDRLTECFAREVSRCPNTTYSSRYDNPSAGWVYMCSILMFFMKAGFLYLEEAFSQADKVFRRRVVLAKYIDIFAGTIGFWLFGYAISGNTDAGVLGEEQDYIFWFFRFTFATNTATILGGTLVGQGVQMRALAIFVYSFVMTAFIHPSLARFFWSSSNPQQPAWSPYAPCNGTYTADREHTFSFYTEDVELGDYIFFDFAGSGLVHVCGGMGAFVLAVFHKLEISTRTKKIRECCSCLKRSTDDDDARAATYGAERQDVAPEGAKNFLEWMYPSGGGDENVESAALGILILWTTWFAFNAGSAESISGKAVHSAVGRIALVMCLGCASAGIVQTIISGLVQIYKRDETFNSNEIANAVLGALVSVTGCCTFIDPPWAILIGVISVAVYHSGCYIEYLLKLHDGARAFPVHAICGFWGVLCVGIFSKSCLIRETYEDLCFCVTSNLPASVDNHGLLFAYQLGGGLFIMAWSMTLCTIVFLVLWFFPVNFALACLPWVMGFKDKARGLVKFQGNVLFTHFNEIGSPNPDVDVNEPPPTSGHTTPYTAPHTSNVNFGLVSINTAPQEAHDKD